MKVNRTRSLAKDAMRKKKSTSNRPEEKLAYKIIKTYLKGLQYSEEQRIFRFDAIHHAKVDIYIMANDIRYAIRLQGPPHDEKKQKRHDLLQFFNLLHLGVTTIDFPYKTMVNLFLRNKKILNDFQLLSAYTEIRRELMRYDLHMNSFELNNTELQD
jgi:hypothetical protein